MRTIFLCLLISFTFSLHSFAQEKECVITLKVSGIRADGEGTHDGEFEVKKRCYDFDEAGIQESIKFERKRYAGFDFEYLSKPSKKQDCAGYTAERLFGIGKYWMGADKFFDNFLIFFGKKVETSAFSWGDIRAGDVLVYWGGASAKHITYVREVNRTLGVVTSIVTETKESMESLYKQTIHVNTQDNSVDPLRIMGSIYVYHIDPSKITITEVSKTCDCGVTGTWNFVCCDGKFSGKMILEQNENKITGKFDFSQMGNVTGGQIAGEINGVSVKFKRTWDGGSQDYDLILSDDEKTLTGNFDGRRNNAIGNDVRATRQ